MLNRHLFAGHETVLVAVSGGSDSLALLYLLKDATRPDRLVAATVDHGLRPEAAHEAVRVGSWCAALGVEHTILRLPSPPRSAGQARQARYSALMDHANRRGATAIALGHTLDDQAETLLMRALRMKGDSDTRGLAAMAPLTRRADIDLVRPLLTARRADLQRYLIAQGIEWIDDPSNRNPASERVRVRQTLQSDHGFPDAASLARLAGLCARSRGWLAVSAASAAREHLQRAADGFRLNRANALPRPFAALVIGCAIRTLGARHHFPAPRTIAPILKAMRENRRFRHAVGGCLVTVAEGSVTIRRERERQNKPQPTAADPRALFAGAPDWPLLAVLDDRSRPPVTAITTHPRSI